MNSLEIFYYSYTVIRLMYEWHLFWYIGPMPNYVDV